MNINVILGSGIRYYKWRLSSWFANIKWNFVADISSSRVLFFLYIEKQTEGRSVGKYEYCYSS